MKEKRIEMGATEEALEQTTRTGEARQLELPIWLLAAVLAVATLIVYAPTLRNGFVDFDDHDYVTHNDHVKAGLKWSSVKWAFTSLESGNWHPLTWLSHMADCQAFGLNPAGHHAVSIVLHAINAVLLFWLLYKGTGFALRSLCVAALFALHPLNVETVAWVSERKSLLSMLFSLLAVACYDWYARTPGTESSRRHLRYGAVMPCFALALLCKPMAVTLPLVFLILDYWPLERMAVPFSQDFWKQLLTLTAEKIPLLVMSAASSWITLVAQQGSHATTTTAILPFSLRLANALVSYVKYILKMFWPSQLSYYYPHPGNRLPAWQIAGSVLLIAAIVAAVWRWRERRHLVFGWKLYAVTLLPVIGIIQVGLQGMADRYAYIPLIGLFVAMVWEGSEAAERWHVPAAAQAVVAGGVAVALCAVTVINIGYWHDSVKLFTHGRQVTPFLNTRLETNLGAALLGAGQTREAIEHFRTAEALSPDLFVAHFDIAYALAQESDNRDALPEWQNALRTAQDPQEKERSLNGLAAAYLDSGNSVEAAQTFSDLLVIDPNSLAGHAGRAQALFNMGKYEEAGAEFVAATKLRPAPQLFLMAGKSLEAAGKLREAQEEYVQALKWNPMMNEARQRLESVIKRQSSGL